MNKQIVITGAAGFIASALVRYLNDRGYNNLVLVDDFSRKDRERNYCCKTYDELVERNDFFTWFDLHHQQTAFVFHLGARTDTTEMNAAVFDQWNKAYSQKMWKACSSHGIGLIYASSAATYGDGSLGYKDDENQIPQLQPLNPYGISKNDFDKWVLTQQNNACPPFFAGFKFFNVYGPNEYHKGRMASVVLHAFKQIGQSGGMKLFRSHRLDFKDGMQSRDFIYVKDVVKVLVFFMENAAPQRSGIYNLGTGKARAFLHLVQATFRAMGQAENIGFVDTPLDIRDKYQYYTQADMEKLRKAGYTETFFSLEEGVSDYVQAYLTKDAIY